MRNQIVPLFYFFGVSFSFSFNETKNDKRILDVQVDFFISIRDEGMLHDFYLFKESEKNLRHSISKSLDLC